MDHLYIDVRIKIETICVEYDYYIVSFMPITYLVRNRILHIIYDVLSELPDIIYAAANVYEGNIPDRIGFNFPMKILQQFRTPLTKYEADYVITYQTNDLATKRHELQHAKYDMDIEYQKKVQRLWKSFSPAFQKSIHQKLQKMNYPNHPRILMDEFQAYYFTEKKGFFGKEM